jgi:8-oxo-dGTP diphosphatase
VVCALIENDGKILIAQRSTRQSLSLQWEFPGGKIESGENEVDALVREIQEELGVDIEVGKALTAVAHTYATFTITLRPRLCRLVSGVPTPSEHAAIAWFGPDELRQRDWAPADIPVLEEYLRLRDCENTEFPIGNRVQTIGDST